MAHSVSLNLQDGISSRHSGLGASLSQSLGLGASGGSAARGSVVAMRLSREQASCMTADEVARALSSHTTHGPSRLSLSLYLPSSLRPSFPSFSPSLFPHLS